MSVTAPVSVVLAEDNALLREGLAGVLDRFGFTVLASTADAEGLLRAFTELRPGLVLTDVRMPPGYRDEGIRLALEIRRRRPHQPIVVLSQYVEQTYAAELLSLGSDGIGYLLKDRVTDVRAFLSALTEVAGGGTVIDPEVVRRLLDRRTSPLSRLTGRERETLALMAQGRSNIAIAQELCVTEATVSKHIRSLFDKLDLPQAPTDHRRVLAVLAHLESGQ